jgi:hypothetical protein
LYEVDSVLRHTCRRESTDERLRHRDDTISVPERDALEAFVQAIATTAAGEAVHSTDGRQPTAARDESPDDVRAITVSVDESGFDAGDQRGELLVLREITSCPDNERCNRNSDCGQST